MESQNLSNKSYTDVPEMARERVSFESFLDQITDPQIALLVRQASLKTVNEALACIYLADGVLQDEGLSGGFRNKKGGM